jgi:hypothetical protein
MGKTASLANIGTIADSSLGFRNRIINGAMVIDQRNAGASVASPSDQFITDRFALREVGGGVASAQQVFTSASSGNAPAGFVSSLKLVVTTADASIASTDRYFIRQPIEGLNVADMNFGTANASTFTLSFWVRSSVTGTFPVAFRNNDNTRSYVATYTISAADTWEQKIITVAGDQSGTWVSTSLGAGVNVVWTVGAGSTYNTTANAWQAGDYLNTSGTTQWIATSGATFYITGVQLEKGSTATSFDYRPYGTELALCQRYYEKSFNQATAPAQSAGSTGAFRFVQVKDANVRQISCGTAFFKASKRATPTVTLFNPEAANALPRNLQRALDWTTGGLGTVAASESVLVFNDWTTATSGGLGDDFTVQWTASAEL